MRLLEYQGKEAFREVGIPTPDSRLISVDGPVGDAVGRAAGELQQTSPSGRVVLKAQLNMGGRGKAGLIRVAENAGEAVNAAEEIISAGYTVPALLVEGAVEYEQELYLSVTTDPERARFVILACAEGGIEIEELAASRPEAIKRVEVDPFRGLQGHQARGLAYDLGLPAGAVKAFSRIVGSLYALFRDRDAELAEINPLFVTASGELVAGDAKLIIDDNSLYRQTHYAISREQFDSDAAFEAACEGIPYVQFDGDISLMCAGAGLTTTVFDLVNMEGGSVANYLEFGGPNYRKAERAMELCLKNRSKVILIVTFGTIARADVMAEGVAEAIARLKPDRPIIACIRGTNEEAAEKTLRKAGLEPLSDTEEAVRRAIHLARTAETKEARR
ncbi:MAG: succinate--CoA ligase subunit beta [Spirochaetales bacterium]|nr:succinate--CoA ligase subunit beta [Spirochaetales bacterium]